MVASHKTSLIIFQKAYACTHSRKKTEGEMILPCRFIQSYLLQGCWISDNSFVRLSANILVTSSLCQGPRLDFITLSRNVNLLLMVLFHNDIYQIAMIDCIGASFVENIRVETNRRFSNSGVTPSWPASDWFARFGVGLAQSVLIRA